MEFFFFSFFFSDNILGLEGVVVVYICKARQGKALSKVGKALIFLRLYVHTTVIPLYAFWGHHWTRVVAFVF